MNDEDDDIDLDLGLEDDHPEAAREAAADASRARSAEILARTPSPEELAERAARAKRNKIDAIMSGDLPRVPRYPALVTKRRDDALLQDAGPDSDGQPGSARAVQANARLCTAPPRPSDEAALLAVWATRCADLVSMKPAEAMREILRDMGGLALATHRRHARFEAKIAKLKRHVRELRRTAKAGRERGAAADATAQADTAKAGSKPRIRIASGRAPQ